jgi:cytochrome c peroxidase
VLVNRTETDNRQEVNMKTKTMKQMTASVLAFTMVVFGLLPAGGGLPVALAQDSTAAINPGLVRAAARAAGLDSLANVPVPVVENLAEFLKPGTGAKREVIRLGKALFWDMQVGSDGQACASCHFHAGADSRARNQLSPGLKAGDTLFGNPGVGGTGFPHFGPDYTLVAIDFPLHDLVNSEEENFLLREVRRDTNDVVSSMGVFASTFDGVAPGIPGDLGTPFVDTIFNILTPTAGNIGDNVRRVEPRNTPTVINAVFNHSNFWDGRAHNIFNGVSVIGPLDGGARIWVAAAVGSLSQAQVRIPNSSLASQAVGPPLSDLEMSFFNRTFPQIGRKLLGLTPLGQQMVDPNDSVLGKLSRARQGRPGINNTYSAMIRQAFQPKYWDSVQQTPEGYTLMEANFSLFFGLAVQMYESTLVSDRTPFDRFMEGDDTTLTQEQLRGLLTFINFGDRQQVAGGQFADLFAGISRGSCIPCHFGAEFTSSTVAVVSTGPIEIDFVPRILNGLLVPTDPLVLMFQDEGFYNIGVRPSDEDLGRGDRINGIPISFSGQASEGFNFPFAELRPDPEFPGAFPADNISTKGKFKVPGLRNVELTGPYFHNGGQATLAQVLEFYDRKGDFSDVNIDDVDGPLAEVELAEGDEEALVAFMLSLTDDRVRNEMAPFDHPQLFVLNGGTVAFPADSIVVPAVGAGGRPAAGLPPLGTFLGVSHSD